MAFRAKEAAVGLMLALAARADVSIDVRHDHLRGFGAGTLTATDSGLVFEEGKHKWSLAWQDIQRLWISPRKLRVLSYADSKWKLGADREYELDAASFEPLYAFVKDKLDQRLVAALPDVGADAQWRIPAKQRERFGGPEGVLVIAADRIVFDSPEKGKSRTWRVEDIDNISSSGPFDFTVTTLERSYNFQLKQRISERQFNDLWRPLNRAKQLEFISSIQEKKQ